MKTKFCNKLTVGNYSGLTKRYWLGDKIQLCLDVFLGLLAMSFWAKLFPF